jgi:hypothetical protein
MQHGVQRIVIAIHIDHDDGLVVHPKLRFGRHFKKLVKGSKAARQHDKGIRHGQHQGFAFLHVRRDDELVFHRDGRFQILQKSWNDSLYRGPACFRRHGNIAHQPLASAAKHQRIAHFSDTAADGACRVTKVRIRAIG